MTARKECHPQRPRSCGCCFPRKWTSFWSKSLLLLVTIGVYHYASDVYWTKSVANSLAKLEHFQKQLATTNGSECVVPQLVPFAAEVMPYVHDPGEIVCDSTPELVTIETRSGGEVVATAKSECELSDVVRVGDDRVRLEPPVRVGANESVVLRGDFIRVSCPSLTSSPHYYATVVPRELTALPDRGSNEWNVLLLGIDSMSLMNLIRTMPKTYKFLMQREGVFRFDKHMKVGDNTFPNLIPMFTGHPSSAFSDLNGFDSWPLVWSNYSSQGYATYYAEDFPRLSTFNYLDKGFSQQPTDHYMRPYWLALHQENSLDDIVSSVVLSLNANLEIDQLKWKAFCYQSTPRFRIQLDHVESFWTRYARKKKFAVAWFNEVAHEYINTAKLADGHFEGLLRRMETDGHLNNTVVLFLSDHGHRYAPIRQTYQGRIEERLPFLFAMLPAGLRRHWPAVRRNTAIITSPFDVYETMVHVLQLGKRGARWSSQGRAGTSLLTPLRPDRTCSTASVPEQYCACEQSEPVAVDEPRVVQAAQLAIDLMNHHLAKYALCAQLRVKQVTRANIRVPHLTSLEKSFEHTPWWSRWLPRPPPTRIYYDVAFKASPGDAFFDVSISYNLNNEQFDASFLLSDISRINRYGNTSECIHDKLMRLYCYCVEKNE